MLMLSNEQSLRTAWPRLLPTASSSRRAPLDKPAQQGTHLREAAGLRLLQPHQHGVQLDLQGGWTGAARQKLKEE